MKNVKAVFWAGVKNIQSSFWSGLMLVVALGAPLFVFLQIWQWIGALAGWIGLKFVANTNLNVAIYLGSLIIVVCVFGWTFKFKLFRMCFDWLMEKIPLASTVAKFIPKHEELEILSGSNLEQVRFEISPGVWAMGLAMKEPVYGKRKFIRIYVATSPVPLTGNLLEVDPNLVQVEYTGGGMDDYSAMVASFGVRSTERPTKLKIIPRI